jgi:hypothetical protein
MPKAKPNTIAPPEPTPLPVPEKPKPALPFWVTYNSDKDVWEVPANHIEHLASLYGVGDYSLAVNLFHGTINAAPPATKDNMYNLSPNGANAFMLDMQPGNAVETMLLSQMITIHQHTMLTAARLTNTTKLGISDTYTKQLNQLSRTFTTQIDALHKLRNGGKQTVQVLHQHVQAEPGSQVMVGQQAKA